MLVYVSSYPRSGSSLMQQTINTFFEKPWTEVDSINKPLNRVTGVPKYFTNWRYDQERLESQKSTGWKYWWSKLNQKVLKLYTLEDWIALYDLNIPPHTKNCRYLLPGCLNILTPKNRQKLAQEPTYFFVKTHHHPYPEYFEGEYVLQIVRHPAQVFTSYHNFIKKYYQSPKSLHDIIHGNIPYGSWSEWHLAWEEISPQLKDRFLQLKFKDVVSNQLKACE
ncbi:MAG: sulfotransferase domain-containing protein [Limnoraphis sp.]